MLCLNYTINDKFARLKSSKCTVNELCAEYAQCELLHDVLLGRLVCVEVQPVENLQRRQQTPPTARCCPMVGQFEAGE